jgi:hypothetical protein|uniref:Uncharacterized protein n=1 Tax=Eutreptiella gymnastica TaxID=73025 RepID=A0A7S4FX56_9EUGL|mmetsp:Transcript_38789/g.64448  ORF Transcript_38789/g.64448 Transcript_38789/m.64448 type:complete len:152 (+) Transcript_38789:340-795(+)
MQRAVGQGYAPVARRRPHKKHMALDVRMLKDLISQFGSEPTTVVVTSSSLIKCWGGCYNHGHHTHILPLALKKQDTALSKKSNQTPPTTIEACIHVGTFVQETKIMQNFQMYRAHSCNQGCWECGIMVSCQGNHIEYHQQFAKTSAQFSTE